jgi:hypothetical protein
MRTYVTECQKLPPGGMDGYAPQSQVMTGLRNLSMKVMTLDCAWALELLDQSDGRLV